MRRFILFTLPFLTGLVAFGWANANTDSQQRAVEALQKAIQSDPQNAELWTHLGFAQRKLDQLDAAAVSFEKAVSLNPSSQESLYMLGLIYEKLKRPQEALRVWK